MSQSPEEFNGIKNQIDPMDRGERISQVIDEMLKSDSFDELLADEEVNLSISNFVKSLIQQDIKQFVFDLLWSRTDEKSSDDCKANRKRHKELFGLLEIDLEHIKKHLRNAARNKATDQVVDEILHPNRED